MGIGQSEACQDPRIGSASTAWKDPLNFIVQELSHQAASSIQARRVVARVEFHCEEFFPRVGFIVANLALNKRAVVRFYNKGGTAEQSIKESKQPVAMTRPSCLPFRANEARL